MAYVWIDVVILRFISSIGQKFQRGGGGDMVLIAVETVPVGSKPPAAVGVRISKGRIHDFGASAPLSTRASSLQGRAEGSAIMPNIINSSGRHRPLQKRYPRPSLDLLQRHPPFACESFCQVLRLPPWQDMTGELLTPG